MPDNTPILGLPLIQSAQAQKHITHNEALRLLDILVMPVVADRTRTAPPATPAEGARHIVAANATGAWAGQDGKIAAFWGGEWVFVSPAPGWALRVAAEAVTLCYDIAGWTIARADQMAGLGINTAPDSTNRLAVSSDAALFTHAGTSHQIKVNKAGPAATASLLFQTAWGGRAEIGTTGTDDLSVKVSADGAQWTTALTIAASGLVSGAAVQQAADDATAGRLLRAGAFGLGALSPTLLAQLDATGTPAGNYRTSDTATAGTFPSLITGTQKIGLLEITRLDATTLLQRWTSAAAGTEWLRLCNAGVWGAWGRSGAVIDTATGANGTYTRYGDGTLICSRRGVVTSASLAANSYLEAVWTYPMAFVTGSFPVITTTVAATADAAGRQSAARNLRSVGDPTSNTAGVVGVVNTGTAALAVRADCVAIGRWM